ncbi:MAG TPA: hypothetical protein ENF93_01435, partial [Ignisphaera sp.]|nr:hypothetical protein [Ignisphaera sp.]
AYAELIDKIFNNSEYGVILAVYPSYEFMNHVLQYLEGAEPSIIETDDLSIGNVLAKCRELTKVLINAVAGGKFTEGIEIIRNGESLIKVIIIAGVPYPQPDDYINAIKSIMTSRGSSFSDFYRVIAATRTLQALGRAIRSKEDYAIAILADYRFLDPALLKLLRLRIRAATRSLSRLVFLVKAFYEQLKMLR